MASSSMFFLLLDRYASDIIFPTLEDLDEDGATDDDFAVFLISLCISKWPYDLERPYLHSSSLPIGSINQFAQGADSSSLEQVTRLDRPTFSLLLLPFESHYQFTLTLGETKGRKSSRKLTASGCLALALHFLSHAPSLCSLCLMTGCVMSTTSRYLTFSLKILLRVLREEQNASLSAPSHEYMIKLGELAETVMGHPCMRGCIMVTDGSLHALEKDAEANSNFFFDHSHPDYNGWKGCYCKKGISSFFFLKSQFLIQVSTSSSLMGQLYGVQLTALEVGQMHISLIEPRNSSSTCPLVCGCWEIVHFQGYQGD